MKDNSNLSKSQLDKLIGTASENSGIQAEKFKNALESGNLDNVIKNLKPGDAKKLQNVLSDREATDRMLSSPQAQQLLKRFLQQKDSQ